MQTNCFWESQAGSLLYSMSEFIYTLHEKQDIAWRNGMLASSPTAVRRGPADGAATYRMLVKGRRATASLPFRLCKVAFPPGSHLQRGPKIGTIFIRLNYIKYSPIFEIVSLLESKKIFNYTTTKDPTTPQVYCYTTLWKCH